MPEPRKLIQVLVQGLGEGPEEGIAVSVPDGAMVSTALLQAGVPCRVSVSGEPRTALCGMGICFECRAVVDGVPHRRTCQIVCREGMQIRTMP